MSPGMLYPRVFRVRSDHSVSLFLSKSTVTVVEINANLPRFQPGTRTHDLLFFFCSSITVLLLGGQGKGCTWGDRRKLEMFHSRVNWSDPKTPEVASTVPIGKPENPESMVCVV